MHLREFEEVKDSFQGNQKQNKLKEQAEILDGKKKKPKTLKPRIQHLKFSEKEQIGELTERSKGESISNSATEG